jgi:hypothetical protein
MDTLRIDTGHKKVQINDGPEFIEFNPTEVNWGRRFERLRSDVKTRMDEMSAKIAGIEKRAQELNEETPAMIEEVNNLRDEVCVFIREKIDILFGTGTSQKVFGDLMSEYAIASFLEGIAPFIQSGREQMVTKYLPKNNRKKHKVM